MATKTTGITVGYRLKFVRRLKQLRLKAGYSSQEKIAQDLGVDRNTYASYESRSLVPHNLIPLVCELLNVGPWMLLTGQSDQFAPPLENGDMPYHVDQPIRLGTRKEFSELSDDAQEFAKKISTLDRADRNKVNEMIDLVSKGQDIAEGILKSCAKQGIGFDATLERLRAKIR